MRLAKMLLVLLLSAVGGFAQQNGAGTQPPDSSQTSQQPENPLQEQPKPAENAPAQPQKPTFDAASGTSDSGQDQQLGEIRLMTRYTELNGDPTRSFKEEGSNNLAEFNYFLDRRFLVTRRIQVLSMFRSTDDRSIDPERNSLQKAYVRIFGPRDEYIFGDTLVNFSRLTFNQNIKGVSLSHMIGSDWKATGVGGIFIDRYGSLYKDLLGRPYLAAVGGGRLERKLGRDSRLGFNLSISRDDEGSLPFAAAGTAPSPANNAVGSIDGRFQFRNSLRFETEFAYSQTDFDSRTALACVAPCDLRLPQATLNGSQTDWGGRFEGSYRFHRLSLRGSYVRYQPNFASINARQIADLQDLLFRTSYDLNDWMTVDGTVRRSNNDLKGQLPFETVLWGPEARFLFHDLPFYRRAVFEVGYRHRDVSGSDGSISRFVRMPYAEFSLPVERISFTIGYERRQAQDQVDPSQTSNTDRFYGGLRGILDWKDWIINPSLRYELERQNSRPELTALPLDTRLERDSNRLASVSLYIEAPRWVIMEGAFRSSSATIFGPNGFSRPSYRGAVTYKIRNDANTLFTFGFERNSNFYFTSPDYDERIWSGTLVYRFGRRAQ